MVDRNSAADHSSIGAVHAPLVVRQRTLDRPDVGLSETVRRIAFGPFRFCLTSPKSDADLPLH
jgi:hypothetical protein